jgi:hypothetical protein
MVSLAVTTSCGTNSSSTTSSRPSHDAEAADAVRRRELSADCREPQADCAWATHTSRGAHRGGSWLAGRGGEERAVTQATQHAALVRNERAMRWCGI